MLIWVVSKLRPSSSKICLIITREKRSRVTVGVSVTSAKVAGVFVTSATHRVGRGIGSRWIIPAPGLYRLITQVIRIFGDHFGSGRSKGELCYIIQSKKGVTLVGLATMNFIQKLWLTATSITLSLNLLTRNSKIKY